MSRLPRIIGVQTPSAKGCVKPYRRLYRPLLAIVLMVLVATMWCQVDCVVSTKTQLSGSVQFQQVNMALDAVYAPEDFSVQGSRFFREWLVWHEPYELHLVFHDYSKHLRKVRIRDIVIINGNSRWVCNIEDKGEIAWEHFEKVPWTTDFCMALFVLSNCELDLERDVRLSRDNAVDSSRDYELHYTADIVTSSGETKEERGCVKLRLRHERHYMSYVFAKMAGC